MQYQAQYTHTNRHQTYVYVDFDIQNMNIQVESNNTAKGYCLNKALRIHTKSNNKTKNKNTKTKKQNPRQTFLSFLLFLKPYEIKVKIYKQNKN